MSNWLVGIGAGTVLMLAVGIVFTWKNAWPTFTAWWMLVVGVGLIGTSFEVVVRLVTGRLDSKIPAAALGVCLAIWIADVWGKKNHVGRATAIVALFVPTLAVVAGVTFFGFNTADLGRDAKTAVQQTVMTGGEK
ncbi:hypothetical protein ACQP25_17420 [Microtetraspora malaysiensis]|uniref:hypothetical protein n=1 Tax=Microtetraspora malaysiensis TaxID=161358 RepID=UPI003D8E018D